MIINIKEDSWGNLIRIKYILRQINKYATSDTKVLEVGCGTGEYISIPLSRHGLSVLGIDINKDSIEYANNLIDNLKLNNINFQHKNIYEINDESFDVVICSEVLEHLYQPEIMIQDIKRILKIGGIGIITVPNGYGAYEMLNRLSDKYDIYLKPKLKAIGIHKYISKIGKLLDRNRENYCLTSGGSLNNECGHVQKFTLSRLIRLISAEKLKVLDTRGRSFLCGWFLTPIIERSKKLIEMNVKIATNLPPSFCSGWLVTVKKI